MVVGGDVDEEQKYVAPTILMNVKESDPVMMEEVGRDHALYKNNHPCFDDNNTLYMF